MWWKSWGCEELGDTKLRIQVGLTMLMSQGRLSHGKAKRPMKNGGGGEVGEQGGGSQL